jgi:LacI family transcriptional regulator
MVTQEQIAQKLGVSRQLVTFALAGYPQVSEASRRRILAAAKKMGYRPNPHARALRRSRTGIVALWIPDQISSHYNHVARELNQLVRGAGFELIISEVRAAGAKQTLSHVPVDGVIAVDAPAQVEAYAKSVFARSIPMVGMGAYYSGKTDFVRVDLQSGTRDLMGHLLASGYRRIAHATYLKNDRTQEGRRLGYQLAMREAGLKPEFIYYSLAGRLRPSTRQLIRDYIGRHGCPEAIFSHSDDAALGIYRGLCDLGLRVPDDVALAGCDGIEAVEYLERPLTTLVQPVPEMCAAVWELLLKRMKDPATKPQGIVLKPALAIRESSRRIAAGAGKSAVND